MNHSECKKKPTKRIAVAETSFNRWPPDFRFQKASKIYNEILEDDKTNAVRIDNANFDP